MLVPWTGWARYTGALEGFGTLEKPCPLTSLSGSPQAHGKRCQLQIYCQKCHQHLIKCTGKNQTHNVMYAHMFISTLLTVHTIQCTCNDRNSHIELTFLKWYNTGWRKLLLFARSLYLSTLPLKVSFLCRCTNTAN